MPRAVKCWCPQCQREVVAVQHRRVTGTRVVAIGVFALAAKKRDALSCPACGSPLNAALRPPNAVRMAPVTAASIPGSANWKRGQYRCEKNGHLLGKTHVVCPIDGSAVRRVGATPPRALPARQAHAVGWYPDPGGKHDHRYHDGARWTEHVADAGVAAIDPLG